MNTPEPVAVREGFTVLPGMSVTHAERRVALRALMSPDVPASIVPGAYDALSARLCERAGFEAVYLTGAGVSNSHLALPDVGLIGFADMLDKAGRIVEATRVPVIVDADNGYGGPVTVARAVALFENAGVSAIQLEDQGFPKRCGHFDGKSLVSVAAMQAKIDAAVNARRDPNTVIIARTDAKGVTGFDDAIKRAEAYREAGADVLFVEAPESAAEVESVPRLLGGIPLLINVVEGGRTPVPSAKALDAMGYQFILHANFVLRAMAGAVGSALQLLKSDVGKLPENFLPWSERQQMVGLPELDAYEDELRLKWNWTD